MTGWAPDIALALILLMVQTWVVARALRNARAAGYLRGRSQMLYGYMEAQRRGFTSEQWLTSQLEHDRDYLASMLRGRARAKFLTEWEST